MVQSKIKTDDKHILPVCLLLSVVLYQKYTEKKRYGHKQD